MTSRPDMIIAAVLCIAGVLIAPFIQPPWLLALIAILVSGIFYLMKNTHYPAIGISVVALFYGLGLVSLMVFLGTLVIVILGEAVFRLVEKIELKYLANIIVSMIAALGVYFYLGYGNILVPITGVIVALLLKSALKKREDALMIECFGTAMTMYLFEDISFSVEITSLILALIISFAFGLTAYRMKAADRSGLFSGALMGLLIIVFSNVTWFLLMLSFFILGTAFTKYKYEIKKREGVAESRGGVRGFTNVFANGLVALCGAVLYGIYGDLAFLALYVGSIAAATADTTASELGMLGKQPFLITTLQPVPKGTDGGVTIMGELLAILAALIIGIVAFALGIGPPEIIPVAVIAGFVGTNVDSLVGATLERKKIIGNSGTNMFCTIAGGVAAMLLLH
ncbi:TIGR00297 family protein [Methanolacinia paynteri]|uniref:TIGR00297 family protein n=1 Tax=Methanolacinia paynteri TaxID=230356 RepID=UPI00064E48D1|nr:TIGR00297 family protein [Methanolacinia paynteri]